VACFSVRRLAAVLVLAAPLALAPAASAQGEKPSAGMTTALDCRGSVGGCDRDYVQTEIGFTRFVRDPSDADIYVLITAEKTGSGGQRATLLFEGRRGAFAGRRDTLVALTSTGASADDERRALTARLALGLAGFAGRTALADRIHVAYQAPAGGTPDVLPDEESDPWNHWVFRVQGSGFLNGQASSTSTNVNGSVSAERVTEDWKLVFSPSGSYRRNSYDLGEDGTVVTTNGQASLFTRAVRSVSDHWSAGLQFRARRSSFDNLAAQARLSPAVEYNLFPYVESTRRQVRLSYELTGEAVAYVDTTIFGKTDDLLLGHEAGVSSAFAQPWGSTYVGVDLSQYLTKPDKYRASLSGSVSMRVARGLNVNMGGSFSFVRDQIALRTGGATPEEILTQQRQLATNFDYSARLGLSYVFGSIYNQVVNARFGG
jgi:hypothetical protein